MNFKRALTDKEQLGNPNAEEVTKNLYLKARSLLVFSGEVRYNWLHSIATRKIDKVEIDSKDNMGLQ